MPLLQQEVLPIMQSRCLGRFQPVAADVIGLANMRCICMKRTRHVSYHASRLYKGVRGGTADLTNTDKQ